MRIDDDEYISRKEDLLDLIKDKNSPWYINYNWSNEANKIRELYISEIGAINLNNIEQYFKTLRLIDKNVNMSSVASNSKVAIFLFLDQKY